MMRTVLLALSARPAIGQAMSRLALTCGLVRRYFKRRLAERRAHLLFLRNLAG